MFFRFIFYCILAYAAIRFVRWIMKPSSARASQRKRPNAAQMIRCESCGMFITQRSALLIGGRDYCSRSCAEKVNRV